MFFQPAVVAEGFSLCQIQVDIHWTAVQIPPGEMIYMVPKIEAVSIYYPASMNGPAILKCKGTLSRFPGKKG